MHVVLFSLLGLHMLVSMFTSFSGFDLLADLESSPLTESHDIISQLDKIARSVVVYMIN